MPTLPRKRRKGEKGETISVSVLQGMCSPLFILLARRHCSFAFLGSRIFAVFSLLPEWSPRYATDPLRHQVDATIVCDSPVNRADDTKTSNAHDSTVIPPSVIAGCVGANWLFKFLILRHNTTDRREAAWTAPKPC